MDTIKHIGQFIADHQLTLHELITIVHSVPGVFYGSVALLLLAIYKPTRPFVIGGMLIGIFFI
jgi:hypothetical protein